MALRIGGILKLLQNNRAGNRVAEFVSGFDGSTHTVLSAGESYLSTIGFHEVAALDAHRFGHGEDEVIATDGRDECQSYARVSAGGFNDGRTWFEDAFLLCIFYHRQCDAVFYTSARVEEFNLCDDGSLEPFEGGEFLEFQKGSVTDKLGKLFCYCHNCKPPLIPLKGVAICGGDRPFVFLFYIIINYLNGLEGFVQGIDKVIDVLGANAQTNGGWIDVGLLQFLGTHLRMGSRSGMDDKALHISNICQ